MATLAEQYKRHRAEALHTNIAPKGNSTMTPEQLKQIIHETVGTKMDDMIVQITKFAQREKRLAADIAEIKAKQDADGVTGAADRQKEMAANASGGMGNSQYVSLLPD